MLFTERNLKGGDWTLIIVISFVIVVLMFSALLSFQLPQDFYSSQTSTTNNNDKEKEDKDEVQNKLNEKRYNLNYKPSDFYFGVEDKNEVSLHQWTSINCFRTMEPELKKRQQPKYNCPTQQQQQQQQLIKTDDKNMQNEKFDNENKKETPANTEGCTTKKESEDLSSLLKHSCRKYRCMLKNVNVYMDTSINILMHIPPVDSIPPVPPSFTGHLPCSTEFSKRQGKVVRFIVSDELYNPRIPECSFSFDEETPVYIASSIFGNNMFHMIYDVLLPLANTFLADHSELDTNNQIIIDYALEDPRNSQNPARDLFQLFSDKSIKTMREAVYSDKKLCIRDLRLGLESSFGICSHSTNAPFFYCHDLLQHVVNHVKAKLKLDYKVPYDDIQITYLKSKRIGRIVNEEQMMDTFRKLATKMGGSAKQVYLSEMDLVQQVRTMHDTSVLVGLHGDDLSNAVWMREGTAAIVIYPHGCNNYIYNHMMKLRNVTDFIYKCSPADTQFSSFENRRQAMDNGWPDVDLLQDALGACPIQLKDNDIHVNTDSMELAVKKAIEEVLIWAQKHNKL